jgi:hypothetical protein
VLPWLRAIPLIQPACTWEMPLRLTCFQVLRRRTSGRKSQSVEAVTCVEPRLIGSQACAIRRRSYFPSPLDTLLTLDFPTPLLEACSKLYHAVLPLLPPSLTHTVQSTSAQLVLSIRPLLVVSIRPLLPATSVQPFPG